MEDIRRLVAFSGGVSSPPRGVFFGWTIVMPGRKTPGSPYLDTGNCRVARYSLPARPSFYQTAFPSQVWLKKHTVTGLIDHEEVFERVTRLLATVIFLLVLGIFRAVDRTFGPIMKKRAVVGPASVRFAASAWQVVGCPGWKQLLVC